MSAIFCKKCKASDFSKNGIVRGLQRYVCKACKCNFTMTPERGRSPAIKALATVLYGLGNMSFGSIGRILGVSDVSVLNWVRATAAALPEPVVPADVKIVMIDEMHHFVKKSLKKYGCGEPLILSSGELSPGLWVSVMMQAAKNSSTK